LLLLVAGVLGLVGGLLLYLYGVFAWRFLAGELACVVVDFCYGVAVGASAAASAFATAHLIEVLTQKSFTLLLHFLNIGQRNEPIQPEQLHIDPVQLHYDRQNHHEYYQNARNSQPEQNATGMFIRRKPRIKIRRKVSEFIIREFRKSLQRIVLYKAEILRNRRTQRRLIKRLKVIERNGQPRRHQLKHRITILKFLRGIPAAIRKLKSLVYFGRVEAVARVESDLFANESDDGRL
jgi:hypothetical protein